jgi:16S rRNA (guanine527-N7)-methyltransferase
MNNLKNIFTKYNLSLNDKQIRKFESLKKLFIEWNSKINLSAIKNEDEIIIKHFLDSCLAVNFVNFTGKKIMDLGTGGGFPVLPLAILTGEKFIAVDSIRKKLTAVQDMADKLNLKVKTIHTRAEQLAQDKNFTGKFDLVVTRAVTKWDNLLKITLPFLKKGGILCAYQGPAILEELKNFSGNFPGKIIKTETIELEGMERVFILVKKL